MGEGHMIESARDPHCPKVSHMSFSETNTDLKTINKTTNIRIWFYFLYSRASKKTSANYR